MAQGQQGQVLEWLLKYTVGASKCAKGFKKFEKYSVSYCISLQPLEAASQSKEAKKYFAVLELLAKHYAVENGESPKKRIYALPQKEGEVYFVFTPKPKKEEDIYEVLISLQKARPLGEVEKVDLQ